MVYLIGGNHLVQFDSPNVKIVLAERVAFKAHVLEIIKNFNISILAEEFSEEAKMKWRVSESKLEHLGKATGIEHCFCDPTPIERKENGIEQSDSDKREQFWLSRIKDCKNKNVLFVCGSDHLESFGEKLIAAGFVVKLDPKIWCNFSDAEIWADV